MIPAAPAPSRITSPRRKRKANTAKAPPANVPQHQRRTRRGGARTQEARRPPPRTRSRTSSSSPRPSGVRQWPFSFFYADQVSCVL